MPVSVISDPITLDQLPKAGAQVDAEDIRARRAAAFAIADRQDGGGGQINLEKLATEPTKSREMVESVVVQTPVGEIEFGPPQGVSLTMRLATIAGEKNLNRMESAILRTLMCVRKIDGKAVTPINSEVEAQFLANMLGDPVIDFLFETMAETWPPPTKGDLQILSKNLRRP